MFTKGRSCPQAALILVTFYYLLFVGLLTLPEQLGVSRQMSSWGQWANKQLGSVGSSSSKVSSSGHKSPGYIIHIIHQQNSVINFFNVCNIYIYFVSKQALRRGLGSCSVYRAYNAPLKKLSKVVKSCQKVL